MNVLQTHSFKNTIKKLRKNQKQDLDKAVKAVMEDSSIGEMKTGDLAGAQAYKFKMARQHFLLVYSTERQVTTQKITLTLLALRPC